LRNAFCYFESVGSGSPNVPEKLVTSREQFLFFDQFPRRWFCLISS